MKFNIIFDTDTKKCEVTEIEDTKSKTTLADLFANYIGTKEYTGIVATIQKWYYGRLVQASWCVTSACYMANQLGILDQLGGKNENVFLCMNACKKYASTHSEVKFFDKMNIPNKICKGDILFYLWKGNTMNTTSSKHLSICNTDTISDTILSICGNQNDEINITEYDRKYLFALYRPCYKI